MRAAMNRLWPSAVASLFGFGTGALAALAVCGGCGGVSSAPPRSGGVVGLDAGAPPAVEAGSGDAAASWPPKVDPTAFGKADLSRVTVAAFSQVNVDGSDPQVLTLTPDL